MMNLPIFKKAMKSMYLGNFKCVLIFIHTQIKPVSYQPWEDLQMPSEVIINDTLLKLQDIPYRFAFC